jgi:HSP20 family protein
MSTRSNPLEELEQFFERMSRRFEETSSDWYGDDPLGWRQSVEPMALDLVERDGEFVATVDLPGFERDDVDVRVTDHTLRIDAERETRSEEEEEEAERYVRRERRRESAHRSLRLPAEVDAESVTARMENGVLVVTLPKREVEEAHDIAIE